MSPRLRFLLPIAALIAYFLGLLLFPLIGDTTPILSVLPVVAAGRTLGSRAGLLAALFTTPLNTWILRLGGGGGWESWLRRPEGMLGTVGLIFLGVAVGRLIGLKAEAAAAQIERDDLQDRVRRLGQAEKELIDRLSHDLRTPLHTVKGFLELLRDGRVADASLQREFLMRASLDADRLAAIVDDLMDISLTDEGQLQLVREPFDLNAVVAEVIETLQIMADARQIRLMHLTREPDLMIEGDRRRLRRAVFNLVERAVTVSSPTSPVMVIGRRTDEGVTLQVVDRGGGMTAEVEATVFDRHGRIVGPAESCWGSTGLGLHAIKLILQAHGGRVGVASQPGVGSTFTLTIPAQKRGPTWFTPYPHSEA